ncbi:hypothetical protein HDU88_006419 [Geranomyces variabilis]|nr:hypothetical protein HDU88_006419 [Geranomyces variabilis]
MVSASAFALVCVSALMISGASAATNSTGAAANTTEPAICTNYYASCERARSACSDSSSSTAAMSCVPAASGDWAAGSCPACNSTSFFNVSDAAGAVLSPQPFTFVLGEATPLLIKGYCLSQSRCRDGRAAAIVLETGKVNKNGDDEWVGFCACDGRSAPIEPFEVGQLVSVPAGSGGPGVAVANVSINGNRTTSTAASPSSASGTATTSLAAAKSAATSSAAATASAQAEPGQTSANSAGHATSAASVFALLAVFAASFSAFV